MKPVQLGTRIDPRVKKALVAACEARGVKIGRFVEDALLDKLEELEDVQDVRALRKEKTRPLAEVLEALKRDGKL